MYMMQFSCPIFKTRGGPRASLIGIWTLSSARFANHVAGARRATGMSIFALGGNLGFAVGPLLVTWVSTSFSYAISFLICYTE